MQQQQMSPQYSAQQQQQHTPSQPQIRRQQQPSLSSAQAYQQHPQYQMQQHPQQQVSARVARQPHGVPPLSAYLTDFPSISSLLYLSFIHFPTKTPCSVF